MDYEQFEITCRRLDRLVDAVSETSFENWPRSAKALAVSAPLLSISIGPGQLRSLLARNDHARRFLALDGTAAVALDLDGADMIEDEIFPKLGPVSWKEAPSHTRLAPPQLELELRAALGQVTDRMSAILSPLAAQSVPTALHLFAWRDFDPLVEVRMSMVDGEVTRGRWQRHPEGWNPSLEVRGACIEIARKAVSEFLTRELEVDLSVEQRNGNLHVRLIELNPSLNEMRST